MENILQNVSGKRASVNTIYHVLYGYFFIGLSKSKLAKIYKKHKSTIANWIRTFQENGYFSRKEYETDARKFGADKRAWLIELYFSQPTLYLDESKKLFEQNFGISISTSSICRILHQEGLTYKVLERRAIQIRSEDIIRFCNELQQIKWDYHNLVFLDEVSFDNRSMLRSRGYGVRGQRLICRGEYVRKPRMSLLCFIGVDGVKEVYSTEGTFNRAKFFDCCRKFCTDSKDVYRYPGYHSIWIMDGARIHCDAMIISFLRSLGIYTIFLPAYCPFFNPIEVVFGNVKRALKKEHSEKSKLDYKLCIAETFQSYSNRNMQNLFRKCGYIRGGRFDPSLGLEKDLIWLGFEDNSEKKRNM